MTTKDNRRAKGRRLDKGTCPTRQAKSLSARRKKSRTIFSLKESTKARHGRKENDGDRPVFIRVTTSLSAVITGGKNSGLQNHREAGTGCRGNGEKLSALRQHVREVRVGEVCKKKTRVLQGAAKGEIKFVLGSGQGGTQLRQVPNEQ